MTVEPVHRSDIPCEGVVSELDVAVMGTLQGEVRYRINGPELVLSGPDGTSLTLRADDGSAGTPAPATSQPSMANPPVSMMDGPTG